MKMDRLRFVMGQLTHFHLQGRGKKLDVDFVLRANLASQIGIIFKWICSFFVEIVYINNCLLLAKQAIFMFDKILSKVWIFLIIMPSLYFLHHENTPD